MSFRLCSFITAATEDVSGEAKTISQDKISTRDDRSALSMKGLESGFAYTMPDKLIIEEVNPDVLPDDGL